MAPRLPASANQPPKSAAKARKAKGAGGAKRSSKPTNRMKTPEQDKPARGANKAAARAAAPRQPTEAETRAATQQRLVALHHQHEEANTKIIVAQEALAVLKTNKAEIRAAIQNSCVPLAIYDEVLGKVRKKTKRNDNELYEKQRALAFEAFALPCGAQPELDLTGKMPDPARAAVYWEEVGYQTIVAGSGQFLDPQRDGVPPENLQDYMKGGERGNATLGAGIKALKEKPAPSAAPANTAVEPSMVGEDPTKAADKRAARQANKETAGAAPAQTYNQPSWDGFDNDPDLWSDEQRAIFQQWFDGLPEDADVEITHPGVGSAFDAAIGEEDDVAATAAAEPERPVVH